MKIFFSPIFMLFLVIHFTCEARPIKPIPDELLIRAKREMNFKSDIKLPPLIATPAVKLVDDICRKKGCVVTGMYYKKKIYYDNRLRFKKDLVDRSIIYHELIHHIQRVRHGPTYNCKRWMLNEREAYKLQEKYLVEKGLKGAVDFKWILANIECPIKSQT